MFIQGSPAALHPVNLRGLGAINFVPGVSRADLDMVLRAYADNVRAQIMPDDAAINYWMQVGLDNFDATVEAVRKADPSLAAQIDAERLAAVTEYFGRLTGDPDEDLNRLQLAAMMKQNELKASLVMSQVAPVVTAPVVAPVVTAPVVAPVVTPAVKDYVLIESQPNQLVPVYVGPVIAPPIAPPPTEDQLVNYPSDEPWLVAPETVTPKTPVVTDNVVIKDSRTVPAETTIKPTTPAPAMPTGAIFAAIAAYLLLG